MAKHMHYKYLYYRLVNVNIHHFFQTVTGDVRAALEALLAVMEGSASDGGTARDAPCCPRCGCPHVVKRGRDADGAQRWLCRGCGRTFRGSTGSALAASKIDSAVWAEYAAMMVSGGTLKNCAAVCEVSLSTSFSMYHRLLVVMERSPARVRGQAGVPGEGRQDPRNRLVV